MNHNPLPCRATHPALAKIRATNVAASTIERIAFRFTDRKPTPERTA